MMNRQPLFILLISFCLGIFLEDYFGFDERFVFLTSSLSTLSIVVVYYFNKSFFTKLQTPILWIFFLSLGVFTHHLNSISPVFEQSTGKEKIVFKLKKKLNSNAQNKRYEVVATTSNSKNKIPVNVFLSVPKDKPDLDFKNYYQAEVYLKTIDPPEFDYQFNYKKFASRKNVYHQAFVYSEIHSTPKNLTILESIKQKRLEVLSKIDRSSLQKNNKEFLKGIVLADRTETDKQVTENFNRSGLVHILAISGTHMAIIFWLILWLLKPIFPLKHRNIPIIISIILIWSFAMFIGYGNSVVRSCVMISVYYAMILLQRKPDLLHALSLAGFGILIFDSQQLFDVGFILSFSAVFGIYWLNKPLLNLLSNTKYSILKFFYKIIAVTFSAQIATLPFVLYYFHQFSLISIISNLLILPFIEIIILFSLMMTFLLSFSIDLEILTKTYDLFVEVLLKTIQHLANLDFAFFNLISINFFEVIILFGFIYYLRFLLLDFSWKNILISTYVLFSFAFVRMIINFYHYQTSEVLIHNYYKNSIVSVKNRDEITFYIKDRDKIESIQKYVIQPYLIHRRTKEYNIKTVPENCEIIRTPNRIISLK